MTPVRLLLAVTLVAALLGAGGEVRAERAELATHTLEHQGKTRTYHLFVPPGHVKAKAVPFVLALHGGGGSGRKAGSWLVKETWPPR